MKRTLVIFSLAVSTTITICLLIGTSQVRPKGSTVISTRVLKQDSPILIDKQISSKEFQKIILSKLPKSSRVNYEEAISLIKVTYDESVKSQYFVTYHYSAYQNSWGYLFFDASVHNYVLQSAIDNSILQLSESVSDSRLASN